MVRIEIFLDHSEEETRTFWKRNYISLTYFFYKHSKLKLGVRVMRDRLRVGLVQTTVSYTKSNINLSYLIASDRRDVEVYANAIIIIR